MNRHQEKAVEEKQRERRLKWAGAVASLVAIAVIIGVLYGLGHIVLNLKFKATHEYLTQHNLEWITETIYPHPKLVGPDHTIGEVLSERWKTRLTWVEQAAVKIDTMLGPTLRVALRVAFWLWLSFVFMVFFRVFTFMGYFRALRTALFMGAVFYALLPNLTRTMWDEITFLAIATGLIVLRFLWVRTRRRRDMEEDTDEGLKETGPKLDLHDRAAPPDPLIQPSPSPSGRTLLDRLPASTDK